MVMGGNILVVAGEDKTSRAGLLVRALVTVCRLACVCQEALQKQANFGGAGGKGEKSLAKHGGSNASQYGALQYILLIATAGPLLAVYAFKLELQEHIRAHSLHPDKQPPHAGNKHGWTPESRAHHDQHHSVAAHCQDAESATPITASSPV